MSRPPLNTNISFNDSDVPPSRRAGHGNNPHTQQQQHPQRPPPVPSKGGASKYSLEPNVPTLGYEEAGYPNQGFSQAGADVRRKKSMVRPERERIDPGHRLYHYREHAAGDDMRVHPSLTGNQPYAPGRGGGSGGANVRRGKSVLGRDSDQPNNESGLHLFKRGATIRRKASQANPRPATAAAPPRPPEKTGCCQDIAPGPVDCWMIYCFVITCWIPPFVLSGLFGKRTPDAQRAFREKMGIVSICATLMAIVGFITFGFTQAVCTNKGGRVQAGHVNNASIIIGGSYYDFGDWKHPVVGPFNGTNSPLYMDDWNSAGKDVSFMFQDVNQHCLGIMEPGPKAPDAMKLGTKDGKPLMGYYFPCNQFGQNATATANLTGYESITNCHIKSDAARKQLKDIHAAGVVYYTWAQVKDPSRNLAVYKGSVIDMSLLGWLNPDYVKYPALFDTMKGGNDTFHQRDVSSLVARTGWDKQFDCLADVIRVGYVDSMSIGCMASQIVLYVSLVFILGAVLIKFFMALFFGWFLSWRMGNFENESYKERMKRAEEIENWTDDIYKAAPGHFRPNARDASHRPPKKGHFLPTQSRFSKAEPMMVGNSRPGTAYGSSLDMQRRGQSSSLYGSKLTPAGLRDTPPGSPMLRGSGSSTSLPFRNESSLSLYGDSNGGCPWPLNNVIPQPAPDFEPFGYPLVHTMCLVTAYSESIEGLRTTMDSIATTDYPNSHKLILVVCDGMVRGAGSKQYTPDIVLSMMKELVVPADQVEAHSYVAIADGHKRHNMAKVYAGFYDYDNETVEPSKQQRVPVVLVAKTGNPLERNDAKPGNRGKRDSQIVLMSFLQKVMFDERMTTFEYEFFNSLWRCTGVSADKYETVLCVDADTKVFPDSISRMNACMINDTEIMGLCGETKIANKRETWVTMIQVFEYYISHHLTKAFESVFGGVTCLPGCFSMYRIKTPKGASGYWVPILANPDIVEHYSENVVDTLHKKNLLLLGEDRYLSTLMLKTFPKRKMMWCPQAVCKTVVPDTFRVLLSQRRRWINSTIHNLFELMLVRDLCGTFCFSMQFVVFMDLVGTLVLPAAIAFTIYVIALAIVSAVNPKQDTPTVSLILLAFILGLPGVLIVITSRKLVYVGWMLMYLVSLPIWNFVLPAYSFWHMDDFSWGQTRTVEGETKENAAHGDKEGQFDSSHIVMKRWVEFERERRWRDGTMSRDSHSFDVIQRSTSPGRNLNHRYSMGSTTESYQGNYPDSSLRPNQPAYGGQFVTSPVDNVSHLSPGEYEYQRNRSPVDNRTYTEEEQPMLARGSASPEDYPRDDRRQPPVQSPSRGVSLVDPGYTPSSAQDPVRRVQRQHNRRSSGRGITSPTSSSGHNLSNLPPGAAPARF